MVCSSHLSSSIPSSVCGSQLTAGLVWLQVSLMCHQTGSGVLHFSDKLICLSFGDLGDGISLEICIEVWGSQR